MFHWYSIGSYFFLSGPVRFNFPQINSTAAAAVTRSLLILIAFHQSAKEFLNKFSFLSNRLSSPVQMSPVLILDERTMGWKEKKITQGGWHRRVTIIEVCKSSVAQIWCDFPTLMKSLPGIQGIWGLLAQREFFVTVLVDVVYICVLLYWRQGLARDLASPLHYLGLSSYNKLL